METGKLFGNRIRLERGWRREADGEGERERKDRRTVSYRNGSGVDLRTLNYEYSGSNPVLRC